MKKSVLKKYNYKTITVLFDLDWAEDKELVEWLVAHRGKKNGYSVMMKKALGEKIKREAIESGEVDEGVGSEAKSMVEVVDEVMIEAGFTPRAIGVGESEDE
jgi:hypothetical protein